jgi:hypothetical protein
VRHEDAVQELIHDLDEANVPADWGYRRIREWDAARRPGQAATEKACREASDARKGREAAQALAKAHNNTSAKKALPGSGS